MLQVKTAKSNQVIKTLEKKDLVFQDYLDTLRQCSLVYTCFGSFQSAICMCMYFTTQLEHFLGSEIFSVKAMAVIRESWKIILQKNVSNLDTSSAFHFILKYIQVKYLAKITKTKYIIQYIV